MTRAARGRPEVASRSRALSSATHAASDADRWNERMTRVLREAAEVRDELGRARSAEDARLARQGSEACLALIATLHSSDSQPAGSRDRPRRRSVPPAPGPR